MKLSWSVCFLVLLVLLPTSGITEASSVPQPTAQLRVHIDQIVILLERNGSGAEDKLHTTDLIMKIAQKGFDFREMSKRVLSKNWKKMSQAQQDLFVVQFTQLLKYAYVDKIGKYGNNDIEYIKERVRGKRAEVQTQLISEGKLLSVSYIMHLKNEQWRVYDVVVEGVSLVRNYLEQFKEIMAAQGVQGLIELLEAKVLELKKETSAG